METIINKKKGNKMGQIDKEYEGYVENITHLLIDRWNPKFRKYVGVDLKGIEEVIRNAYGEWTLVKRSTSKLYEDRVPIREAVEELYLALDIYYNASAAAM